MLKPEALAAILAGVLVLALPAVHLLPAAAHAQTTISAASPTAALADLLMMNDTFDVMAEEGRAHGADLEAGYFPGRGGARWSEAVDAIYDPAAIRDRFLKAFETALGDDDAAIAAAETFFGSDLGQRILRLEIEARRVMIDKDATEAAEVAAEKLKAERAPIIRQIRKLIEAGDMVEMNVAGALTANLAFLQGMAETAPAAQAAPAEELMSEVWSQEASVRSSTTTWLYSYMALAYGPLSEAEMQSYIDYWATPEGKALNAALYAAFDAAFVPVSRDLGRATGEALVGSDI
jgi:hypothetical protein